MTTRDAAVLNTFEIPLGGLLSDFQIVSLKAFLFLMTTLMDSKSTRDAKKAVTGNENNCCEVNTSANTYPT